MITVNEIVASLLSEDPTDPKRRELEKGLTREEAMKQFPYSPKMGDCRGFSYDPDTGIATWM
jgi:hypothetical protein